MKLLLDTQILIWSMRDPDKLSKKLRTIIEDEDNQLYISVASLWEMNIKIALNKLSLPTGYLDAIYDSDVVILPIAREHLHVLSVLPHHHGDPFDRMIVAQAKYENLPLVTSDKALEQYQLKVIM